MDQVWEERPTTAPGLGQDLPASLVLATAGVCMSVCLPAFSSNKKVKCVSSKASLIIPFQHCSEFGHFFSPPPLLRPPTDVAFVFSGAMKEGLLGFFFSFLFNALNIIV